MADRPATVLCRVRGAFLSMLALTLALALAQAQAWAQGTVLEVLTLRYRTVEQVLPVIKPLLAPGGTASGLQGQLVVRTSPGNLEEIRRVLASIDTVPRRLLISVRQDAYAAYDERAVGIAGGVVRPGDARVRARVVDSATGDSDRNTQTVQTLEGSPAFIRVGQSVPLEREAVRTWSGGRVVEQSVGATEYRDVTSGFYALPRVTGDRVTLEISPQREALSGQVSGAIDVQRAVTTVSGRLGEWIEVAGSSQSATSERSYVLGRTAATGSDTRRVVVKVEEIK